MVPTPPDVADGLLPLERRLLHAMADEDAVVPAPRRKTTRILERLLGGEAPSVEDHLASNAALRESTDPVAVAYAALVDFATPFRTRYGLVDAAGHLGTRTGSPADHFYTECRLTPWGKAVLNRTAPNLLANGARAGDSGALHFVPHNLREVVDLLVAALQSSTPREAVAHAFPTFVPDFPTGGVMVGISDSLLEHGHGTVRLRARVRGDEIQGARCVVVEGFPEAIDLDAIIQRGCALVLSKQLAGAIDLIALSEEGGGAIALVAAHGSALPPIEEVVFASLPLEAVITVDGVAQVDGQAQPLGLVDLVEQTLAHQLARMRQARPTASETSLRSATIEVLRALAATCGDGRRTTRG